MTTTVDACIIAALETKLAEADARIAALSEAARRHVQQADDLFGETRTGRGWREWALDPKVRLAHPHAETLLDLAEALAAFEQEAA
jgi:hypothetical protein